MLTTVLVLSSVAIVIFTTVLVLQTRIFQSLRVITELGESQDKLIEVLTEELSTCKKKMAEAEARANAATNISIEHAKRLADYEAILHEVDSLLSIIVKEANGGALIPGPHHPESCKVIGCYWCRAIDKIKEIREL